MKVMEVESCAKVNLTLDVLGKRPDGYHNLETVMQEIGMKDGIKIEEKGRAIEIKCNSAGVPCDERNLCWKAVERMWERKGEKKGVRIGIEKKIPAAGGLGGGSSNAAAVLKGLNELWKLGLGDEELIKEAEQIGMDVCFFIKGKTCFVHGRQEKVERIRGLKETWFVIVNPGTEVSTKEAYAGLDYGKAGKAGSSRKLREAIEKGKSAGEMAKLIHNDFEFSVLEKHPEIREARERLLGEGCLNALLCGSGASVFGIAESEEKAGSIAKRLKGEFPVVEVAKSV